MWVAWTGHVVALAQIVGLPEDTDLFSPPSNERSLLACMGAELLGLDPVPTDMHLRAWRWMWSLPPCSEARKAAFTLGHAALLIDLYRRNREGIAQARTDLAGEELAISMAERLGIERGRAAERELRIAAWHIDDARGERAAIDLHGALAPTIPPHERVYQRGTGLDDRLLLDGRKTIVSVHAKPEVLARAIFVNRTLAGPVAFSKHLEAGEAIEHLTSTAIASLPDGPWVMTSLDVERFLNTVLEEHAPRIDGYAAAHVETARQLADETARRWGKR